MKIVHIAPNSPYNEGWGYQENILPKYQKKLGHDVTLIITNETHEKGSIVKKACKDFYSSDGFRVITRNRVNSKIPIVGRTVTKIEVEDLLFDIKPDFIFYHGLISATIYQVAKYKEKNPNCVIVQDNHLDYNIGFNPNSIKGSILKLIYRKIYRDNDKYIKKVYGVTPWRKKYAEEVFGVPQYKTDILIMGAPDDELCLTNKVRLRKEIRGKYKINENDFLIVTGGKIDDKKKIHLLMKAVNSMEDVKLLVFGEVNDNIKQKFEHELSSKIIWIGWIESMLVYQYFFASDLAFFPGQHSVLWEQACASKIPSVFERWEGMDHINNGGNSELLFPINEKTIREKIEELKFTQKYFAMRTIAESKKTDIYLYSRIAEKSLEAITEGNKQ